MTEGPIAKAQRKRDYTEFVALVRKGRDVTPEERVRRRELRALLPKSKASVHPKE